MADVQAGTGADRHAGWSLVVAYQDVTQPARNLTIFDGFGQVALNANVYNRSAGEVSNDHYNAWDFSKDLDSITAKFELTLSMQETGNGLAARQGRRRRRPGGRTGRDGRGAGESVAVLADDGVVFTRGAIGEQW